MATALPFIFRWMHLLSHCFSCGHTRPHTAGSELVSEDTLTLFCRLAVEFDEDFRITDRYEQSGGFTYPLIFAR